MTYRSWHLITIRSVATSWAFAAEIISMINTAMSFGARLVGAEIDLENTHNRKAGTNQSILWQQSWNRNETKRNSTERICNFITYSKMYLPRIRIWRIHCSHTHSHTHIQSHFLCLCVCERESLGKLNQYPFKSHRQLPSGWLWSPSTFSSGNCRGICFQYKILIIPGSWNQLMGTLGASFPLEIY